MSQGDEMATGGDRKSDGRAARRRGSSVLVVLALVAITMGLSFALLRDETVSRQLQQNVNRNELARQAARAGMAIALNKMHQQSWSGADTTINGNLSETESYTVSYATGDASLASGDADYAKWPYRVTVLSTGVSTDPTTSPATSSTYKIETVVQLVPRALASRSANWSAMMNYNAVQVATGTVEFHTPCQIEGPIWLQSGVSLQSDYRMSTSVTQTYFNDLRARAWSGRGDYRPLTGSIRMPLSQTNSTTRSLMTNNLGLTLVNSSSSTLVDRSWQGTYDTYRLYPGGKEYSVPRIHSSLSNVTLSASPETNPLGVYYSDSSLTLGNDVKIDGALVVRGNLYVSGKRIRLRSVSQPAVDGGSAPVHVQAVFASSDVRVEEGSDASIEGMVAAWDEFRVSSGAENTDFDLRGKLFAAQIDIRSRDNWHAMNPSDWSDTVSYYNNFFDDWFDLYSDFLNWGYGLDSRPRIQVRAPSAQQQHHFLERNDTLYDRHANDAGLKWDVMRWTDGV